MANRRAGYDELQGTETGKSGIIKASMASYALSIFLSAFLLFQIQPLISKYILPWFGGTPAVWSSAMLFFQVLLLTGYAYAAWLVAIPDTKRQAKFHMALLGGSIGLLLVAGLAWGTPILPGVEWRPIDASLPVWHVLKVLSVAVGLPYLVLSTNSPLMQAWFNRSYAGRTPYRLYALSNLGSMLALVTYPFLVEPFFSLQVQGRFWTLGYLIFAGLAGYQALEMLRQGRVVQKQKSTPLAIPDVPPAAQEHLLWILLSACASVMLLATTNQITQDVAAIPFLWILPLTLYLLTFILAFGSERWYSRRVYGPILLVSSSLYLWVLTQGEGLNILIQVGTYALVLFAACMICHGELARLKPHPSYLTGFYLMVSIGGVLGGVAVNFIAPYVFNGYWEFQIGLLAVWASLLFLSIRNPLPSRTPKGAYLASAQAVVTILVLSVSMSFFYWGQTSRVVLATRNFYGVLRVIESHSGFPDNQNRLYNGQITHGFQYTGEQRHLPSSYYTEQSGVGLAILNHPRREQGLRVGVLGLGIGTLAAYGQPGDTFRFYEINPDVIDLAEGEGGYFTYLSDSRAQIETVTGDARISLERELAENRPQQFDVLVLDTFTSDSIPVHLLTREALSIYQAHMASGGLIAVHLSNKHLDLSPVVWALANHFDLAAGLISSPGEGERQSPSVWMLLSKDKTFLAQPAFKERITPQPEPFVGSRLWTDDYSNLFPYLR